MKDEKIGFVEYGVLDFLALFEEIILPAFQRDYGFYIVVACFYCEF